MSQQFVLDCSVTMAWFFPYQASPATDALLDRLNHDGSALVAQHGSLEVGNSMLFGERRKRSTPANTAHFLGILSSLDIETDWATEAQALAATLALARDHNLTL